MKNNTNAIRDIIPYIVPYLEFDNDSPTSLVIVNIRITNTRAIIKKRNSITKYKEFK